MTAPFFPSALLLLCLCLVFHPAIVHAAHQHPSKSSADKKETFFRSFLNAAGLSPSPSKSRGPPSPPSGSFSDQTKYVALGGTGAAIAIGDFNRDRLPDLLMLDTDTYRGVSVQFWDHEQFRFIHRGLGASIDGSRLSKIVSAQTGDFNNDGILDVLLTDDERGVVYFGDGDGNFNLTKPLAIPEIPSSTAVVDADADFVPELFVAFSNGTRGFWKFHTRSRLNVTVSFKQWRVRKGACSITAGSSIASTDLNGDCQSEFIIPTRCGLEVWNAPTAAAPLWTLKTPKKLGTDVFNPAQGDAVVVYDDFNGDGTVDIAVGNTEKHELLVHLNMQKMRAEGALCEPDLNWRLVRVTGVSYGEFHVSSQRVGKLLRGHNLPPTMHTGDYNSDGRADVLIIDSNTDSPALFRNSGRWRADSQHVDEQFTRMNPTVEKALGGGDAVTAAFFDTGASGRQDILVVRRDNDTKLVWNGVQHDSDALFFRGVALSALPYRDAHSHPFAPIPGGTFKVSYASRLTSRRVVRACSQCAQSGHWLLQPCSCVLALAHIANYVEEMAVGFCGYDQAWPNLMPNSMAIVWAEKDERQYKLRKDYFTLTQRRSGAMFSVVAVLAAALAVLGAAILYLRDKEKQQDIEDTILERQRLFHFGGV